MISLRDYALAYVQSLPKDADAVREFDDVANTIRSTKPLNAFLSDSSVALSAKHDALVAAFPKAQEATVNFITLLARDNATDQIQPLQSYVRHVAAESDGARHAIVTTATPLTGPDLERLAKTLQKKFGSPIKLEERTDPSLIAGFSVAVGDWTLDASLKGKLDRLQHALIV